MLIRHGKTCRYRSDCHEEERFPHRSLETRRYDRHTLEGHTEMHSRQGGERDEHGSERITLGVLQEGKAW